MRIIVVCFIVVLLNIQIAQAQYDPEAKAVLDAMSAKYKNLPAFTASFSMRIETAGVSDTINGNIAVKGTKYKLEMLGTERYNNGKDVWVFTPELEEATVSTYNPDKEVVGPANIYDLHKTGFKYGLISELSNGDKVIQLDPESRNEKYHKTRMTITAKKDLKSFTVFLKNGVQYIYDITNFKPLKSLADSFFVFDEKKYPNVRVEDFR